LAADGTDVNLPTFYSDKKYIVEKFIKNGEGFYQMHINALYDILENRFIDIETQPNTGKSTKFTKWKSLHIV